MRVLLISENPIPAIHRNNRSAFLCKELLERKHKCYVCSYAPPVKDRAFERIVNPIYYEKEFQQFSLSRLFYMSRIPKLSGLIQRENIKVIHTYGLIPGIIGKILHDLTSVPICVDMPDFIEALTSSFGFGSLFMPHLLRKIQTWIVKNSDAVIVESDLAKQIWISRGVLAERIHPIPHATDPTLFDPEKHHSNREDLKIGYNNEFLVMYHGDIGIDDGLDILIEATAIVNKKTDENVRLVVVGDGAPHYIAFLKELAKNLQINTTFTGWVPFRRIPEYISTIDIGIAPFRSTLYTNTVVPTKPLELMAMKKPIIVSHLKNFDSFVRDGIHCLLVPPENPEDLALAILRLIDDHDLRKKLAENGYQVVQQKFSWSSVLKKEIEVIEDLWRSK